MESIAENEENWKAFYTSENPLKMPLPEPYESISELLKLVIFKCLRPDFVYAAIEKFICSFDETFIVNEYVTVKSAFATSTSKTPLIYFTASGIDATTDIMNLAYEINSGEQ